MASDCESDLNGSPAVSDSEEELVKPSLAETKPDVAALLKQLQSSGALVKKQKIELKCVKCNKSYTDWFSLEKHLIEHVSMPNVILEKCDDILDEYGLGDFLDAWESEQQDAEDMDNTEDVKPDTNSALSKLASLGILKKMPETVSKSPIKTPQEDIMKKLGQLGGLKLKLKQSDDHKSFHVVNGESTDKENKDNDSENWPSGDEESDGPPSDVDESSDAIPKESLNDGKHPNSVNNTVTSKSAVLEKPVQKPIDTVIPTPETSNVKIKEEVVDPLTNSELITPQENIKRETGSPPSNSIMSEDKIKKELDVSKSDSTRNSMATNVSAPVLTVPLPLLEPKKEDTGVTVIEINGDSGDDDDDCCVVSTTPGNACDIKPKIEEVVYPPATVANSYSHNSFPTTPVKNAGYNWNTPESKPLDALQKSSEALFDHLYSSPKKDSFPLDTISEYVSIDSLGAQHTCNVCNSRFTSTMGLENHKLATGHSNSLALPSSNAITPTSYGTSSTALLDNLLGRKLLIGQNSQPFTHQQNVLINIQSYPGAMGQPVAQQFNPYGQTAQQPYQGNFQQMPTQFPGPYPTPQNFGYQGQQQQPVQGQFQPQPGQGNYVQSAYPQTSQPNQYPGGMQNNMQQPQQPYQMHQGPSQQMPPPAAPGLHNMTSPSPNSSPSKAGVRIQNVQSFPPGNNQSPGQGIRPRNMTPPRPRAPGVIRPGMRPSMRPGLQVQGQQQLKGKLAPRPPMKRPGAPQNSPMQKRKSDMLLPNRHDNEDCQTMSIQQQREGLPLISNIQGSKLPSGLSVTKKKINPQVNAVANALAARGISIKPKAPVRSPSPERPVPHIPGLSSAVSIKHTPRKTDDGFTIPEARVGGYICKECNRSFPSQSILTTHMANIHSLHKCEDCPASYPKIAQLQHHRRVAHDSDNSRELGLPVVDLSDEANVRRLADFGITNYIPISSKEQINGYFGIPVISSRNAANCASLRSLGANGVLNLGPIKSLSNF